METTSCVSRNSDVMVFLTCDGNGIVCDGNPTSLIICMAANVCGNGKSRNCLSSLSVFLLPLMWNFKLTRLNYFWCGLQRLSRISAFWTLPSLRYVFSPNYSKYSIMTVKTEKNLCSWIWFHIHSFYLIPLSLFGSFQCTFSNSLAVCPKVHLGFFLTLLFYNLIPFPASLRNSHSPELKSFSTLDLEERQCIRKLSVYSNMQPVPLGQQAKCDSLKFCSKHGLWGAKGNI